MWLKDARTSQFDIWEDTGLSSNMFSLTNRLPGGGRHFLSVTHPTWWLTTRRRQAVSTLKHNQALAEWTLQLDIGAIQHLYLWKLGRTKTQELDTVSATQRMFYRGFKYFLLANHLATRIRKQSVKKPSCVLPNHFTISALLLISNSLLFKHEIRVSFI